MTGPGFDEREDCRATFVPALSNCNSGETSVAHMSFQFALLGAFLDRNRTSTRPPFHLSLTTYGTTSTPFRLDLPVPRASTTLQSNQKEPATAAPDIADLHILGFA